jgi:HAD superfamily hydrolase (TIGR01509 family)
MVHQYKAILFDMDGVVVDSMPYHYLSWKQIFGSMGIHLDKMEVYKREGEQGIGSISSILSEHGKSFDVEEIQKMLRDKESLFKKIASPRLFPGIKAFIQDLKKNGYRLGLVTGTSRDEIGSVLPSSIIKSFDVVVSGDNVKRGKPAPDPYMKAIEDLEVIPADTLVIENAPYGIQSAKQAGTFCIAITTSLPREYLHEADFICDSLEEVRKLILGNGLGAKITERNGRGVA